MQKTANSKMRRRMRGMLFCFMIFGFSVICCRLFFIQIVRGEEYQQMAVEQQTRANTLGAQRGTIYDRNGNVLAQSATVWNVCISPAQLNRETLAKVATDLAEILDTTAEDILERAEDRSSYYKIIKRRIERSLADEAMQYCADNNVSGVFLEQDTRRYYPYGSLASTVLGFTNYDNQGAYGIESYYESVLAGTPGMVVSTKNAWGADMPYKYSQLYEAKDGNSIVLTIDESIQHFLERNLETAVVEHSIGNRASGIVMDVKTGEILAMATKPDFNPNDPNTLKDPLSIELLSNYTEGTEEYESVLTDLRYDQWRNKAISDPYEPGSVFKIITAAMALDNNLVSLDSHFYCNVIYTVSDRDYSCWQKRGHGDQNFIEAMQNSCNPAFIMVGQRVGARNFYDYFDNFGLMELTGIDLPGEATGIMHSFDTLNKEGGVELASSSFGQTFKVTSIQLITATSAAVNGGYLMQPYIVKQVLDAQGNVIETTQPTVKRQVISTATSEILQTMTEAVVDGGSGRYAAIPGYRIGGKTGTSQKIGESDKHVLSFVGFAPADDPQIACLIILDEPGLASGEAFGSTIAAPVVGAVLQEVLPYMGIEAQFTAEQLVQAEVTVPDLIGEKPHDAQAELRGKELNARFVGNGGEVVAQIPQAWQNMPKGGTVILYTEEESINTDIELPSVVGLTALEANTTLIGLGLNIEIRGVTTDGVPTVVGEQWPLPGTVLETGEVVIVTLIEKPEDDGSESAGQE